MDFGLARREDGEARLTLEGQILGTPAYMSPEQARGGASRVDGRGDIYSLGVILYEVLTGELPFRGVTRMVLQQILTEEPRPPRQLNDKIPHDLETITLKCLAKEPERRYATAGALTADLRRHLRGEPILARPVGRAERCWRWAKRNPRLAWLSGVALLLAVTVVVGSVAAALLIEQKRQAALAAESRARTAQAEAEANAALANERLTATLDTLDKLVVDFQSQLHDHPAMLKLQESLLQTAVDGLERAAHDSREGKPTPNLAGAHKRLGDIYLARGQTAAARREFEQGLAVAQRLLAADDATRPSAASYVCAFTLRFAGLSLREGDTAAAHDYARKAVALAEEMAATSADPVDAARRLGACYLRLGEVQLKLGNPKVAAASLRQAVDRSRKVLDAEGTYQDRLEAAAPLTSLADAALQQGDLAAARAAYRQALDVLDGAARMRPDGIGARRAIVGVRDRLGDLALRERNLPAARDEYRAVLAECERLTAADPFNPLLRRELSIAHYKVAGISEQLNDVPAALASYARALERLEELEANQPQDAQAVHDVAAVYQKLTWLEAWAEHAGKAREYGGRALRRYERLAAADPANVLTQNDLAVMYDTAGKSAAVLRDYAEAARCYEQAAALLCPLTAGERFQNVPGSATWLPQFVGQMTFYRSACRAIDDLEFALAQPPSWARQLLMIRARALARQGRHAEAAATAEKLRALAPEDGSNLFDVACCYARCAGGVGPPDEPERLSHEEAATRARYVAQAVRDLAAAAEHGYTDLPHFEYDRDLTALRGDKAYVEVVHRLKAAAAPAKPGP
jgi:tetratricopeptide (TPR) repeat protein